MARPDTIVIEGRAYSWRALVALRKAQLDAWRKAQGEQPALFELVDDSRPKPSARRRGAMKSRPCSNGCAMPMGKERQPDNGLDSSTKLLAFLTTSINVNYMEKSMQLNNRSRKVELSKIFTCLAVAATTGMFGGYAASFLFNAAALSDVAVAASALATVGNFAVCGFCLYKSASHALALPNATALSVNPQPPR